MNKMIWIVSAFALGGCMSVKPVEAPVSTVNALQEQKLTIVTYDMPYLQGTTVSKVVLGPGALCAATCPDGGSIVRENEIQDPALAIEPKLTAIVSERLKPSDTARIVNRPRELDSEKSLSKDVGGRGVVLDVETVDWDFIYFPFDWTHYQLRYSARARLIDANTGKRIAQSPCQYKSQDKEPPSYDQMFGNKAARLKVMLATAADICAERMAAGLYAR